MGSILNHMGNISSYLKTGGFGVKIGVAFEFVLDSEVSQIDLKKLDSSCPLTCLISSGEIILY